MFTKVVIFKVWLEIFRPTTSISYKVYGKDMQEMYIMYLFIFASCELLNCYFTTRISLNFINMIIAESFDEM